MADLSAPDWARPVRVASIPAAHPYVRGLGLECAGAELLPDPPVPGAPAGQWWPPAMLEPGWVATHRDTFDLMHLHFGFESLSPDALDELLAALRAARRPVVYTIHDLSHPQLDDQTRHRDQLELLIGSADGLITLTPGAAAEVEARWNRRPLLVTHAAVLDLESIPPQPPPSPTPVIGIALRDLRPSIDGPGATAALIAAAACLRRAGRSVQVRVTMHDHVREPAARDEVRRLCAGAADTELHEGKRPGDAELERELATLAVCVLPYRHGTHSGWLELCWDLGVPVAAPAVGYFADQHPEPEFVAPFAAGDAGSLTVALAALLARPEAEVSSMARRRVQLRRREVRLGQRVEVAAAHVRHYRELVSAAGVTPLGSRG